MGQLPKSGAGDVVKEVIDLNEHVMNEEDQSQGQRNDVVEDPEEE